MNINLKKIKPIIISISCFVAGLLVAILVFYYQNSSKLILDLKESYDSNDRIVATFNGNKPVYLAELEDSLKAISNAKININDIDKDIKDFLINQIVAQKILLSDALKAGFHNNIDDNSIKTVAIAQIRQQFLFKNAKSKVNEADIKAKYQELIDAVKDKKEYQIQHILVADKLKANLVYSKRSQDFASLVKKYSIDKNTIDKDGNLGYILEGATFPELDKELKKLKLNQVSQPIKGPNGWHIVKIVDIRGAKPADYNEVKDAIKTSIASQKAQEYLDDLIKKSNIKVINQK